MSKLTAASALVAALLLSGAARPAAQAGQAPAKAREAKALDVLKSNADHKAKAAACRELALVATRDAVPTLAALLGDAKLSHMARYALEPLPDPAVDAALRAALGTLKGLPLVGVIGSVGVRRDAGATGALAGLLGSSDGAVSAAAARALGSIGTAAAAQALEAALPKAPARSRWAFFEGLFRCAEATAARGEADAAVAIYDRLRAVKGAPHQIRAGALRGAALARGKAGLPLLLQALRGSDYILVAAAARTAMEMPVPELTKALADELAKLPADKQILLTHVLGNRGETDALPALFALARKGETPARVAAIRALAEIPDASTVPVLVALQGDAEVAAAAQESLAALPGAKVDAAIIAMLKDPNAKTRAAAIGLLGQRRVASAVPALLASARDGEESIRVASIKALGDLAGLAEFPALVGLLVQAKSSSEIRAAERALSGLCSRLAQPASGKIVIHKALYGDLPNGRKADVTRKVAAMVKRGALKIEASNTNFGDPAQGIPKKMTIEFSVDGATQTRTVPEKGTITLTTGAPPPACIEALCAALPKAPAEPKLALLRVLRAARGPKALAAVRSAATDANAEIRGAATSLLCDWPGVEALPDVMRLARTATDRKTKILALRGCIRLIPLQAAPDAKKLASLEEVMGLVERNEEKRLALSALAAIPTPEALALVTPHLASPALKEEASLAAVAIAEKILRRHPAQVAKAMETVRKTTANPQTAKDAARLLAQARRARPRK